MMIKPSIADTYNHRIVEWNNHSNKSLIVADAKGYGDRNDQLSYPTNVIIDQQTDSLIICDWQNRRVVKWPRRNGQTGEVLISNIDCHDVNMDKNGYVYVSGWERHEIRRWKIGENIGALIAGGNGRGDRLDQLNNPRNIFIDEDHSVYVSDKENHRVMKWVKGAKGIVVAGGQGEGHGLNQLSYSYGIIVDQLGSVYVADYGNTRVMRWLKGTKEGTIVVGGNGEGQQPNQLNFPTDLSFDRANNLYVLGHGNHRVQRFEVN